MTRYSGNELKYLTEVIKGENLSSTSGTFTERLEKAFAQKIGVKYAIAFNSGTSTMHLSLLALGIKPGDEVIVPALGPIMTSAAVVHAGGIPIFADIDEQTFNIDAKDVARKITHKTKAIIAVHLYGLPCDMDELQKFGFPIIEDCAQAVLSEYKHKFAGSIGAIGSFSFESSKHISCGEGGMVTTNDETLALKIRKLGNHGFKNITAESGRMKADFSTGFGREVFQSPSYKRHNSIGYNCRMSELQAAVALAQLERIDDLVKERVECAKIFGEAISGPMTSQEKTGNTFWAFAVRYNGDWQEFRKKFIAAGGHPFYGCWSVPYDEPAFAGVVPSRIGSKPHPSNCPVAEKVQPQIMQFKTNFMAKEAEKQAEILRKVLS